MKNYFFILLSAFFLQFCVHSKNCHKCSSEDTKKLIIGDYILEVPILYNFVYMPDMSIQYQHIGMIQCRVCKENYISLEYGIFSWDNLPDSEESYIQSGKWYEHKPLEKTKFSVLKANDSIKKLFPACDYYATDSISGKIYPIQIPHEVKNYQFIYRSDSSFKLKIAYSIAFEEDQKYHIWLEAIPSEYHNKLCLHYACHTIKERDFVIGIYKTIKMKE